MNATLFFCTILAAQAWILPVKEAGEWSSLWDPVQLKQRRKLLSQEIQEKKNNTGMIEYVQDSCINGLTETGLAWNSLLNTSDLPASPSWFLRSQMSFALFFFFFRFWDTVPLWSPGCLELTAIVWLAHPVLQKPPRSISNLIFMENIFLEGVEMLMGGKRTVFERNNYIYAT